MKCNIDDCNQTTLVGFKACLRHYRSITNKKCQVAACLKYRDDLYVVCHQHMKIIEEMSFIGIYRTLKMFYICEKNIHG